MTANRKFFLVLLLSVATSIFAGQSTRNRALEDPLLDKLVGDWNVKRKFGNGRVKRNVVHGEWVLKHQFLQLHYRDIAAPSAYEAIVLIGYDEAGKRYICHWSDSFGGAYSGDGFAPRLEGTNEMDFKFDSQDGQLENRFVFDPQTKEWTSTIRQSEHGKWRLFCRDQFVAAVKVDAEK